MIKRLLRPRYRLKYPVSQWLGKAGATRKETMCLQRSAAPDYPLLMERAEPLEERVRTSFASVNQYFAGFPEELYQCDRPVIVEAESGLIFEKGRILNVPAIDDLALRERMVRGALIRQARGHKMSLRGQPVFLLRHIWDYNYFHIVNEVYPQIALAKQHIPDFSATQFIVSPKMWRSRPFSYMRENSPALRGLNFAMQEVNFACDNLYFGSTAMLSKDNYDTFLADLPLDRSEWLKSEDRIFVSRKPTDGRALENAAEIEAVLQRQGFRTVYPGDLSFAAQVETFARARYVVGIHGAGLVNLMFRAGAPMGLLELFAPENVVPHYFNLCCFYDYQYDCVVGETTSAATERGGRFAAHRHYNNLKMDAASVEERLCRLLAS